MRFIIIFAMLVCVASTYRTVGTGRIPTHAKIKDTTEAILQDTTTSINFESSTPSNLLMTTITEQTLSSSSSSSTSAPKPQIEQEILSTSIQPLPQPDESIILTTEKPSRHRIITYDQRQEGQYNIRADLDNFMIVLIPPSPTDGLNLLDLLTKSALRRNSQNTKNKRKYYSSSTPQLGAIKYRQALKNNDYSQTTNFLGPKPVNDVTASRNYFTTLQSSATQPIAIIESSAGHEIPEYIEGRTPYHVDISANDDEYTKLHPEEQVDVLPPSYPLKYPHLIKPYQFEALPPTDIKEPSREFVQLLNSEISNSKAIKHNINGRHRFRASRAIQDNNFVDNNRIAATNNLIIPTIRGTYFPIYRSEYSFGASNLYPPIDVPHYSNFFPINSYDKTNFELKGEYDNEEPNLHDDGQNLENTNTSILWDQSIVSPDDQFETNISNLDTVNPEVKELLSDSTGQCPPGSRRDSYGMCQEIKKYEN